MRHQFIGGPLDSKTKIFMSEEETKEVPWEEYRRGAELKKADGVLDVIVWTHRTIDDQGRAAANFAAAVRAQEGDVITLTLSSQPVDGGYDAVKASIDHRTSEQRLKDMQVDAEGRISAEALRAAGYMGEHPGDGSSNASPATIDLTTSAVETIQEVATIQYPEPKTITGNAELSEHRLEPGDYGTLEGENVWETFEERRKKIKLSRDRLGTDLGGSKSLGWRLESGNVSKSDAKKLGVETVEEVYFLANQLLHKLGA